MTVYGFKLERKYNALKNYCCNFASLTDQCGSALQFSKEMRPVGWRTLLHWWGPDSKYNTTQSWMMKKKVLLKW